MPSFQDQPYIVIPKGHSQPFCNGDKLIDLFFTHHSWRHRLHKRRGLYCILCPVTCNAVNGPVLDVNWPPSSTSRSIGWEAILPNHTMISINHGCQVPVRCQIWCHHNKLCAPKQAVTLKFDIQLPFMDYGCQDCCSSDTCTTGFILWKQMHWSIWASVPPTLPCWYHRFQNINVIILSHWQWTADVQLCWCRPNVWALSQRCPKDYHPATSNWPCKTSN